MRSRGVTSTICGLSSNDVEKPFLQAGADCFVGKPLPTDTQESTEAAYKSASATVDLIVGLVGKDHELAKVLRSLRK